MKPSINSRKRHPYRVALLQDIPLTNRFTLSPTHPAGNRHKRRRDAVLRRRRFLAAE